MFAYVVIFIYATTSSVDSELLELTPIPWTQSVSLVLFFFAVLQMRMAYYQNFCFRSEISVDGQLNLVLMSLLFEALSLPERLLQPMFAYVVIFIYDDRSSWPTQSRSCSSLQSCMRTSKILFPIRKWKSMFRFQVYAMEVFMAEL